VTLTSSLVEDKSADASNDGIGIFLFFRFAVREDILE
jgi:hypothetical protein